MIRNLLDTQNPEEFMFWGFLKPKGKFKIVKFFGWRNPDRDMCKSIYKRDSWVTVQAQQFCSTVVTLIGQSVQTGFCSDVVTLLGQSVWTRFYSDRILLGQNSVRTEFCSAVVTLLGQSVQTKFCSDRILLGRCHSAWAECSDGILFGQNSARTLSLCSGRVFGRGYVRTEFCSDGILLGQNSARPSSLCSGRVFGKNSVRTEFCSIVVTLLEQSVRTELCSGRILFSPCHSARAECSDRVLLGQILGTLHVSPSPLMSFERDLKIFKFLYSSAYDTCGVDEPLRFPRNGSEVGTFNPQLPLPSTSHPFQPSTSKPLPPSSSQPSHSLSRKNALGDVKDQADDKANPKPWYTADEKSGKMSTEDLQNLIWEYPLPEANYGTKFKTSVYEEQVKSGYRLPLHPFALRFFEHYRMAPGQLVPNGWRKLAGLIYLVQTSGYKPDDFKNPGKPTPNNQTKHIFSHIKLRGGLCINEPLSEEQLEWAKIIPPRPIPAGLLIPSLPRAILSMTSVETVPLEMASGSGKSPQGGFLGVLQKAKGKRKEKQPSAELPLFLRGLELLLQNVLHVAADEAQQKREAVKETQKASHRAEELSKQEADHLA
ncbi:hypothetical protein RJ639_022442 [Escallonia herrerae]|uniref:Transposase (putative) gypsy type domain-containing protein n=1 Tax=Escallonia herrerae TaxID=1293975 RepID=A0AA89AH69_9ASTE|nr:hypothetical protein RJ639_022442 [Escallonia herrerae]